MREDAENPQINFSKTRVAGNIGGAIVALGSIAICLVGLPQLRDAFLAAMACGIVVALILRLIPPKRPFTSSILPNGRR